MFGIDIIKKQKLPFAGFLQIGVFLFLFIQKHIFNRYINKIKKAKTKIHITVIKCKATVIPEIKIKEEQLQK